METSQPRQRDTLDKAREALRVGNYAEALEAYDHFFEHALDDDPHASYGVRLSYCLAEWERLGQKYPQALERLQQKRDTALCLLKKTRDPERFHDYVAICRYLKCGDQPVRQFLAYHSSDRELAGSIVKFIWDSLVEATEWDVCGCYLDDSEGKYETVLAKFDQAVSVHKSDPTLGGDDFAEQIEGRFIRDVCNLVLVLENTGRHDEAGWIRERVATDMQSRDCSVLEDRIRERLAL